MSKVARGTASETCAIFHLLTTGYNEIMGLGTPAKRPTSKRSDRWCRTHAEQLYEEADHFKIVSCSLVQIKTSHEKDRPTDYNSRLDGRLKDTIIFTSEIIIPAMVATDQNKSTRERHLCCFSLVSSGLKVSYFPILTVGRGLSKF